MAIEAPKAPRSSAVGARMEVERRRRENRGAEGAEGGRVWGGGVPLPTGGGVWGGDSAPSTENFLILYLKMATFNAFWAVIYIVQFSCTFSR